MFNADFYPTPEEVIKQLLAPILSERGYLPLNGGYLLEPSAGKGDIIEFLLKHRLINREKLVVYELEPELQATLVGKGLPLHGFDFLTYADGYDIGLIIANPPFSQGAKHVLKMWEVLSDGGTIACLLNAETVANPYTEERRLLSLLIEDYGYTVPLGKAFSTAERKTDVEVVAVYLTKPQKEKRDFSHLSLEEDSPSQEEASSTVQTGLTISRNLLDVLFERYLLSLEALRAYIDSSQELGLLAVDLRIKGKSFITYEYNDMLRELKQAFWKYTLERTKYGEKTTHSFREKFYKHIDTVGNLAYSPENVLLVLTSFLADYDKNMVEAAIEVADRLCWYFDTNIKAERGNRWKSNKSWKVNEKLVLPHMVECHPILGWGMKYYDDWRRINDLEKILCWLGGTPYEEVITAQKATENCLGTTEAYESTFFKLRMYKKGTVHFYFLDPALLAEFNYLMAVNRPDLGDGS